MNHLLHKSTYRAKCSARFAVPAISLTTCQWVIRAFRCGSLSDEAASILCS